MGCCRNGEARRRQCRRTPFWWHKRRPGERRVKPEHMAEKGFSGDGVAEEEANQ